MRFPDKRARVIAVVSAVAVVAVVHATYAVVPLSALAATVVLRRRGWITLAAAAGVTGLIWSAIWFVALRGGHHLDRPPATNEFVKAGNTVVMLTGETVLNGRFYAWLGIVALIPLLVLFQRRNTWIGAMVLGPVALVALPGLATLMVAVLGPGQTKRMWNGIPWSLSLAVLVAELAVAFRGLRLAACAAAVAAAGIAYEQLGMRWLASSAVISGVAVAGTVIVLVLALRRTPIRIDTRHVVSPLPVTALIAAVLAGPVIADAGRVGDVVVNGPAKVEGHYRPRVPAQVIDYFRAHDSWRFPVVLAEPYIAYQLAGQSTVYAFAVPEERSRAEPKVAAGLRRDLASQFLSPATRPDVRGKVMDRYRVSYVVTNAAALRKSETAMSREPGLHRVLHVGSWSVYARR